MVSTFFVYGAPVQNKCLIGSLIYLEPLCSCSSCVVTFYWIRTGLLSGNREGGGRKTIQCHDRRGGKKIFKHL